MVNFYNDYVTCQKTAKLSDVAGEQQRGLAPTWTSIALPILLLLTIAALLRSLWLHKECGWSGNHRFWWRLWWRHKVSTEDWEKHGHYKYVLEAKDVFFPDFLRAWRTCPRCPNWWLSCWGENGLMRKWKQCWETTSSVSWLRLRRWADET